MSASTFFQALQEGDLQVVEQLIDQDPALVNPKNESNISEVLVAIYYGKPVIADLLIRRGAHLDMFEAAAAGKLDRVETLLDEDPSLVNANANDGFQPLGLACFFGHEQIVDFLSGNVCIGTRASPGSRNRRMALRSR
ncbi:MAG TPA: ankyrin repeat domain-containing protein [Anaerolineales bacterium]